MKTLKFILNIILYFIGIVITGLGVITIIRSTLGAGAWDTVTNNLSILAHITKGTTSGIVNVFILSFIILYRRKFKFLFVIVPIIGIALAIDFWDLLVFKDYYPIEIFSQFAFFIGGTLILTVGLAFMINSPFPAMVFDELTLIFMEIFKTNSFFKTRMFVEIFAIVLALIFGFLAGIGFGAVNYGSVVLAIIIGPIISMQINFTKKLFAIVNFTLLDDINPIN